MEPDESVQKQKTRSLNTHTHTHAHTHTLGIAAAQHTKMQLRQCLGATQWHRHVEMAYVAATEGETGWMTAKMGRPGVLHYDAAHTC